MRLLLIEDHAMIRQGMGLLLRQLYPDIVIREASTAAGGLQLVAAEERFDVILLDFYLPDASGGLWCRSYVIALRRSRSRFSPAPTIPRISLQP